MTNKKKWMIAAIVAGAVVIAAISAFLIPYMMAISRMPEGQPLVLRENANGGLELTWPGAEKADAYCIEIFDPAKSDQKEQEVVFSQTVTGTSVTLPDLPADRELTLRVSAVVGYTVYGQEKNRLSDETLEVTTTFSVPRIRELVWTADSDAKSISISYQMAQGDICQMSRVYEDGSMHLLQTLGGQETVLSFGDGAQLPMPGYDETVTLSFAAYREIPGLIFYGYPSVSTQVIRDDLLDRDLAVTCTAEGYNVYTLQWRETKGDHYEIQMLDEQSQWVTIDELPKDTERSYTTHHLPACTTVGLRVVAVGGQTMEDSEFAAVSEELILETDASPIFCTIWPTKDLEAYSDTDCLEVVGNVTVGEAYCVLDERDGMFAVRLNGAICYIDSNYCMINLPEYMGNLCSYNITNSYASIYMVHEYQIPSVTNVVTGGYRHVRLSDGTFLVPLLYPTAQKLLVAAKNAVELGYRLKIYDAYRPGQATREIYDRTALVLQEPIPSRTFTGRYVSVPKPTEEGGVVTYELVMTNGVWNLGSFLAAGGSMHNLGIALDLTLEDLETGEEIRMQTSMHDLSFYSTIYSNNENAKILSEIMQGAGLSDLVSEWWHFQDDAVRSELKPPAVWGGIDAECWMADDNGWRYRDVYGNYYAGETVEIDGVEYTFDENGYVQMTTE